MIYSASNPPICPYCSQQAALVDGEAIYPHRSDLKPLRFWLCAPCHAYVGCHKDGAYLPGVGTSDGIWALGRLADAELRMWKSKVHAAFDPVWKSGHMRRRAAYSWLAAALKINHTECHIGMFDVERCKAAIACVQSPDSKKP